MKKILSIFLVLTLVSCGARKVEKSKEEKQSNIESKIDSVNKNISELKKSENINVKTESTTKVDDKDETVTEETTYEPQDKDKPAVITDDKGKKIVLENVKQTIKKTIQKNNKQTENTNKDNSVSRVNTNLNKKNEGEVKSENKSNVTTLTEDRTSDKKEFNVLNLFWLLIPIGLVVIGYRFYKKYRNKLPI